MKTKTKAEKEYLNKVASLGCVICIRAYGPHDPAVVEIHHPRAGVGMGKRSKHYDAIPVCPQHHRHGKDSIHVLGTKGFPKYWGFTEQDLQRDVKQLLGETI
jgi:hypothetical protein